jgi:hypothetical protein
MRVTHLLVASVILCASAASISHAGHDWLVISLDVPEERAPAKLCVLSRVTCDPAHKQRCNKTAPLHSVAEFFNDRDLLARFHVPESSKIPGVDSEITDALTLLATAPLETRRCSSGGYGACAPEIDLQEFYVRSESGALVRPLKLSGQIVCGSQRRARGAAYLQRDGSGEREPRDERSRPPRVALLSLAFHDKAQDGINEIVLEGTVARVHLTSAKSPDVTVQAIGGNYAIAGASSFATDQHMTVRLQPRCDRFFAEVPAHKMPIKTVELRRGETRYTCAPSDPTARIIPLELPFTSAAEDKSLTVTYEGETKSEVHWFEPVPPSPLRLGVRSIQFNWRRPVGCLAERWSELTPPDEAEYWNMACPRAKLSNATPCKLLPLGPGGQMPEVCQYRCEIPKDQPTVSLPAPVAFERMRSHPGNPPEVLYSWRDQIDVVDQELTTVVPPADRRVMLEFADPAQWKNHFGDEIDEIRIHSGQSDNQLDLLDFDHTELPLPWISLPSVGRTCGDRVRVAIAGTGRYDEITFNGGDGRIELSQPYKYRRRTVFYALAGTGELFRHPWSNARSATFADLGLGLQIDLARLMRSLALDVEATGQITHTFYEGIELSKQLASDFTAVSYLRFDLRVAIEWWWSRRVGVAVAGGFGLGTPLYSGDGSTVGPLRRSELIELHPAMLALRPARLWFLAGLGRRGGEQHRDYHTDFLGSPTSDQEKDAQWYVFLRFRTALE